MVMARIDVKVDFVHHYSIRLECIFVNGIVNYYYRVTFSTCDGKLKREWKLKHACTNKEGLP